jgi:hypothetical protein
MLNRLYIKGLGSGYLQISNADSSGHGDTAVLYVGDVGAALRVLSEHRSSMESADGDFKLRRGAADDDCDFEGSLCGTPFGFPISVAHVLKCAFERASFDMVKSRDWPC